ncbi:hypothetical protein GH714_002025 [Hevea brasiliensis]|uniref:NAD-dependent epimerase/dehydratase domain-containing protein n=1 Tax=Hevea brasiliensis TaxID=3981 RepID=A0A6A6KY46_HEVBR|nr:hypothetical protein GH714_002025 [Hevea brasiliensis]
MSGEGKVVCVTGGSGYIASWLVKFLLERGYTVKATVRDPNLIDPAVKGTLNVLKSCAKVPSIKRVVVTSSMASVSYNGKALSPDVVVDETWFSDLAFCESKKLWYVISKIFAEERFAKENGIDLVTIHPGWDFQCAGAQIFPNDNYKFVDARDVANAHIGAFELASASGRLCLVGRVVHYSEFLKIIHKHYPTLHIPEKCQDDKPFVPKYEVSKEKAKALGIDFIPLDVRVVDTIESLKEKGFLNV